MKKIIYGALSMVMVVFFQSCEKDLMEGVNSGEWNHERNVMELSVEAQIGTAVIERDVDEATITVFGVFDRITDLSKVEITNLVISYGASTSNTVGTYLDFSGPDTSATIAIQSHDGSTLDWKVKLSSFASDLDGVWVINEIAMYCDLFSWESWGWDKTIPMQDYLPNVSAENDNIITFVVESADEKGNPTGSFENNAGADGTYGDFSNPEIGDFNSRFRKVIKGKGTWKRDFAQNKVILTDEEGNVVELGLTLGGNLLVESQFEPEKFPAKYVPEDGVALVAEVPYSPQEFDWDVQDWDFEELSHMSKIMWYELKKQ